MLIIDGSERRLSGRELYDAAQRILLGREPESEPAETPEQRSLFGESDA